MGKVIKFPSRLEQRAPAEPFDFTARLRDINRQLRAGRTLMNRPGRLPPPPGDKRKPLPPRPAWLGQACQKLGPCPCEAPCSISHPNSPPRSLEATPHFGETIELLRAYAVIGAARRRVDDGPLPIGKPIGPRKRHRRSR